MHRLAITIALGLFLAIPACSGDASTSQAPSITPAELQARRESDAAPLIVDVRSPEEFASGHIPGAVNIPYDQVAQRMSELQSTHGVALYCAVGPRARKGESALLAAGQTEVLHLEGGLTAWQQAGLPMEGQR